MGKDFPTLNQLLMICRSLILLVIKEVIQWEIKVCSTQSYQVYRQISCCCHCFCLAFVLVVVVVVVVDVVVVVVVNGNGNNDDGL